MVIALKAVKTFVAVDPSRNNPTKNCGADAIKIELGY